MALDDRNAEMAEMAEIGLDHLAEISSFIISADKQLTITWASKPVLARAEDALGLDVSSIVEPIDPPAKLSPSSIAQKLAVNHRMLLKGGGRSTPLIGQWLPRRGEFVLLANPYVAEQEHLQGFSFDDFVAYDLSIDLLSARQEHAASLAEAKSAASALREREQSYRSVLQTALDGFWIIDRKGRIVEVNDSYCTIVGYSREELLRMSLPDVEAMEDSEETAVHIRHIIEHGPDRFLTRHRRKNGQLVDIEVSATYSEQNSGRVVAFLRDITKHKRLQEKTRWLAKVTEDAPEGIAVAGLDGIIQYVNHAWVAMHGHASADDLVGESLALFHTEEQLETEVIPFNEEVKRSGQNTGEVGHVRKDGTTLLTMMAVTLLKDDKDRPYAFAAFVQDITERKRAEDRHRILIESSRDAIMTIEPPSWRFTSGNPATVDMFGARDEAHFISFDPPALSPETQPDGRPSADQAKEMIETAMREGSRFFEWTHCRIDGSPFPATVLLTRVELAEQVFLQATVRDVSKQKHLETELSHARKLEAVGQLAAGIAHEINTPVQFLSDSVHFLKEAFEDQRGLLVKYRQAVDALVANAGREELLEELTEAEETADLEYLEEHVPGSFERCFDGLSRIATIVGSMKEFAHPDRRDKSPADINQALQATLTIAKNEYKYVADVETELGELPPVLCHVGDLNQVFLNLIVNAAHAIGDVVGDTGDRGTIRVRTSHDGATVRIEFEDTGSGIAKAVRDRIFEPFFTTKEVGKGSGQGLAIAHSVIADKHGGALTCKSNEGAGSTFIICLPVGGKDGEQTEAAS